MEEEDTKIQGFQSTVADFLRTEMLLKYFSSSDYTLHLIGEQSMASV